ncbi:hypothetical protein [Sphingobacterium sp.]|uniref:hypothetical protein n=1 Tax=Sphingobacterium sp. TaxID=341027 RepID=UPI0028AABA2F|nr:hypothetical protein [Sphingobacterium sp.]
MPFGAPLDSARGTAQGMGWGDGPRTGFEPGCPSTPLRERDWRMDQDNSDGRAESRPGTGLLIWDWFFNIDTAYAHHLQT